MIALALAVDAFAVALAAGAYLPQVTRRHTFRLAWHFGLFQGGMTLIGWGAGIGFKRFIESFDHWLAFALLLGVGGNMIWEAVKGPEERAPKDPTRGRVMVMLSVATSIDALAVGLSLSVLDLSILQPAAIIALVAAALTAGGLHLGHWIGRTTRLGLWAEVLGGLVLIAIGVNILHQHGVF